MEGCITPNNPAASPQYFHVPKLGISEGDDLFSVFTSFWAKNWASGNVMTFFWSSLHCGQKLDIFGRVNFAKSSPQHGKMVDFAESSPPMLNIDLHPCL